MIDEAAWSRLQEMALAVFGPVAYYMSLLYVAAIVALVILLFSLALLRRMLNP